MTSVFGLQSLSSSDLLFSQRALSFEGVLMTQWCIFKHLIDNSRTYCKIKSKIIKKQNKKQNSISDLERGWIVNMWWVWQEAAPPLHRAVFQPDQENIKFLLKYITIIFEDIDF